MRTIRILIRLRIPIVSDSRFIQLVIATCNPIDMLAANSIIAATLSLVLTHDGNAPRTALACLDNTVRSTSTSAATADVQSTMRDFTFFLSRG